MTLKVGESVKFIISDFDGVFTDGSVMIDEAGHQLKRINFADVMAIHLFLQNGINFGIISGEHTGAIEYLKNKFNLKEVHQGIRDKESVLKSIIEKYSLASDEIVYVGDDVNDIKPMELVKYRIAPANANYKVKNLDGVQVCKNLGGNGVIREIADNLIK